MVIALTDYFALVVPVAIVLVSRYSHLLPPNLNIIGHLVLVRLLELLLHGLQVLSEIAASTVAESISVLSRRCVANWKSGADIGVAKPVGEILHFVGRVLHAILKNNVVGGLRHTWT